MSSFMANAVTATTGTAAALRVGADPHAGPRGRRSPAAADPSAPGRRGRWRPRRRPPRPTGRSATSKPSNSSTSRISFRLSGLSSTTRIRAPIRTSRPGAPGARWTRRRASEQVVPGHRLDQVVGGARGEAAGLLVQDRGDDHREAAGRRICPELLQHLPAVDVRQPDVEQGGGRSQPSNRLQSLRAVAGPDDADAMTVEVGTHQVQRRCGRRRSPRPPGRRSSGLSGAGGPAASRMGMLKPNVLPTPTSDLKAITPPINVTIRRHRVRPRPVPSSRGAPRRPWWKDSKMRSWSSGGMPIPLSVTVTVNRCSGAAPPAPRHDRRPG